jgi:hypothetical protein
VDNRTNECQSVGISSIAVLIFELAWFPFDHLKGGLFELRWHRGETEGKRQVNSEAWFFRVGADVCWLWPRCKKCRGEKTVKEKNRQEVVIEKGMTDNQRIILAGAGDEEVEWETFS